MFESFYSASGAERADGELTTTYVYSRTSATCSAHWSVISSFTKLVLMHICFPSTSACVIYHFRLQWGVTRMSGGVEAGACADSHLGKHHSRWQTWSRRCLSMSSSYIWQKCLSAAARNPRAADSVKEFCKGCNLCCRSCKGCQL